MYQNELYNEYELNIDQRFKIGSYDAFSYHGNQFCILPCDDRTYNEIMELKYLSDAIKYQGDPSIATIVPTKKQTLSANINGVPTVVFQLPRQRWKVVSEGRELGKFHKLTSFPQQQVGEISRLGQWKEFWGGRLDQLEAWINERIQGGRRDEFSRTLTETFPYFLGLTENAIQYLVDCEWRDTFAELSHGVVCYLRFNEKTLKDTAGIKLPIQWVYDHPSRDLAEWVRSYFFGNSKVSDRRIEQFFSEYEQIVPISPLFFQLIYARLLFPVNYYEVIEGYYTSISIQGQKYYEQQFYEIVTKVTDYERFLASFMDRSYSQGGRYGFPKVTWLVQSKKI